MNTVYKNDQFRIFIQFKSPYSKIAYLFNKALYLL